MITGFFNIKNYDINLRRVWEFCTNLLLCAKISLIGIKITRKNTINLLNKVIWCIYRNKILSRYAGSKDTIVIMVTDTSWLVNCQSHDAQMKWTPRNNFRMVMGLMDIRTGHCQLNKLVDDSTCRRSKMRWRRWE